MRKIITLLCLLTYCNFVQAGDSKIIFNWIYVTPVTSSGFSAKLFFSVNITDTSGNPVSDVVVSNISSNLSSSSSFFQYNPSGDNTLDSVSSGDRGMINLTPKGQYATLNNFSAPTNAGDQLPVQIYFSNVGNIQTVASVVCIDENADIDINSGTLLNNSSCGTVAGQ